MARRLILHVGDCKTGSTILQTMLARGDCKPAGLRLFSPGTANHGALARSLGERKALYPARWNAIARRLDGADWDVAVLSTELFEFIPPARVAEAVNTHLAPLADQITVIAYVRPHVGRVLSQCAENLKLGHDTGTQADFLKSFLKRGRLDFAGRLAGWRAAFGDSFQMRPFIRSRLKQGDIRHDFLDLVLQGAPYTLSDSGQDSNAALPIPDLALMRMLQQRFADLPLDNRVTFGKQFGRLLRDRPPTTAAEPLRLPRALYDLLYPTARADAERLDAEWIGAPCFLPDLEAARDATIPTPQSLEAEDHHSPETLRLMAVWADLMARQMGDEPKDFGARLRDGA